MEVLDQTESPRTFQPPLATGFTPVVSFRNSDLYPDNILGRPAGYIHVLDLSSSQWTSSAFIYMQPMWSGQIVPTEGVAGLLARLQVLSEEVRRLQYSVDLAVQVPSEPHLAALRWMEAATGLPQEGLGALLGVTRQTIRNWEGGGAISRANRQRLFAVRDVLERASLRHPGQSELSSWLDSPCGADGRTPAEMIEEGRIDEARYCAVADPRLRVKHTGLESSSLTTSEVKVGTARTVKYRDEDEELLRVYGQPGGEDEDE